MNALSEAFVPAADHITPASVSGRGKASRGRGSRTNGAVRALSEAAATLAPPEASTSSQPQSRGRSRQRRAGKGNKSATSTRSASPSNDPEVVTASQPSLSNRRARFGSRVTSNHQSRQSEPTEQSQLPVPSADSSLQARLSYELLSGTAECAICIATIGSNSSIHSCPVCSGITHLQCIGKWAARSVEETRERANQAANGQVPPIQWRCPSCQSAFPPEQVPKVYRCFCGRKTNPQRLKAKVVPHSCGEACARSRPVGCPHHCPSLCHPGPCEPCTATINEACFCGKDVKRLKCADRTFDAAKTCGKICERQLSCGLHACGLICHSGPCPPCTAVRQKQCYCGKSETADLCASTSSNRIECFGESSHWTGEYTCDQLCTRSYDCGKHSCDQLCHRHETSERLHCPRSPDVISRCPCGKTPLSIQRNSCTDPIPTCQKPCGKELTGCTHFCQEVCHTGECPPCTQTVTSVCRCGHEKRQIGCARLQSETSDFACHRMCRAMRHCGRHPCGNKCCPLSFQETLTFAKNRNKSKASLVETALHEDPTGIHTCPLICGRLLSCGIHTCARNDHRGACSRCLASEFSEVVCHCGGTVLMPPVPCGTIIQCDLPCQRAPPACGHPKVPHACHQDEGCPPCSFLVEKPCQCPKHNLVKNVRCSQARVNCGAVCGLLLPCGAHRCRLGCHLPGECEDPCTQICGKARKLCGHPHEAPCHAPSVCSTGIPCPMMVDVSCACGNIKQRAICGACTSKPTSSAAKVLPCTDVCAANKRNAALAQALGIESRTSSPKQRPTVIYDQSLLEFFLDHSTWCRDIENAFIEFMRSPKQTHLFQPMKQPQREFVHELAELWSFRSESLDAEPNRSVHITKRASSAQPANSLADAAGNLRRPVAMARVDSEKEKRPPANALYLSAVFGMDESALSKSLSGITGMPFDLTWVGEEDCLFVPRMDASVSPETLQTRLFNVKEGIAFTPALNIGQVELCRVTNGQVDWRASWAPARNTSKWSVPPSTLRTTNAFDALDLNKRNGSTPSTLANGNSSQAPRVSVLSGGLYRPPSAVLVGPSRVADNWEDA